MEQIIDFHHHIKGGDLYRREVPAEQVVALADRAGIEKTVIFSMSLPSRESNELTRREAEKFPDRLIPFAHVLPQEGRLALRELDRCFDELGWRGLKLHRGEALEAPVSDFVPLLKKCAEAQRPCLIDVASQIDFARALAEAVPDCPLVIAHLGAPHNEVLVDQFLNLALEYPHLRFDLSYCHVPWKMGEAVEALGARRLLFGSDGPLLHPLIELAKIEVLDLAEEQRRLILHDNAAELLGLD